MGKKFLANSQTNG